jgi:hypothetical protein
MGQSKNEGSLKKAQTDTTATAAKMSNIDGNATTKGADLQGIPPELRSLAQEARKYTSAEEFVKAQVSKETGFTDYHQAPRADKTPVAQRMDDGGDFSLSEVVSGKSTAPSDFFDKNVGARYYSYDNLEGRQSATAIDNVRRALKSGKKDVTITAYRTVPDDVKVDSLQNGDWISFSKEYATQHGERRFDGKYKIIEQEVKPDEVWWDANDINEWGYDNGKGGNRVTQTQRESQLTDLWNKAQGVRKMSELDLADAVSKELTNYDATPLTVNGKMDLSSSDVDFRLMELKDIVEKKALTKEQVQEAADLLNQVGIDVTKL